MSTNGGDPGKVRRQRAGPLAGLSVLDASNLLAGPLASALLADFGADVIKIEHPTMGDPLRSHGAAKDGESLWWKVGSRNKRCITLNLSDQRGQDIFRRLAREVDVVVESYRPGTMERWGLDYEALRAENERLIMARISGFGQRGPLASRPGFGTIGEAMSGFAQRNGAPDGPPTLPPFGLGDSTTAIMTAFGIMVALRAREISGIGQELDVAIIQSLLLVLEPQLIEYDQLGIVAERHGNRSPVNAPRNLYEAADGGWVAISASTATTADRLLRLAGRPDLTQADWFASALGRAAHADDLDAAVAEWVRSMPREDVLEQCDAAGAPASAVYTAADIIDDPQYVAIDAIASVDDPQLGTLRMPGVPFRLSHTPGRIEWAGPTLGAHNAEVFSALGIEEDTLAKLQADGVV